jgi:CRP/FNR family transcriptional regulator
MEDYRPVEEWRRLLALVDVLEPLPPAEIERLASLGSFVPLREGEVLPLAEDRRVLFVLADGKARVYETNPRGEDLTLSVIESGTVLGQTGFVPWRLPELRVEALEPSVVLRLEWEEFADLVRRHPEVGLRTMELLSVRLGVAEDRLSDLTRKDVRARLASLLLKLVEYEGVVAREGVRRIPTPYTHRQLASMIGANREAVTRAFKGLRENGGVEVRDRRIYIVDEERLRGAAG